MRLKKAITEYLGLLCRACGASAARLRFYVGEAGAGEPIVEIQGCVPADQGMELALRESSPFAE